LSPLRLRAEEKITALAPRVPSRRIAFSPDNTTWLSAAAPAPTYLSAAAIEKVPRGGKRRRSQRQKIQRKQIMRNPTPYLKMRVLGAIDMAPGNSIVSGHSKSPTWGRK